jgi:maleylpyruvate isomerase
MPGRGEPTSTSVSVPGVAVQDQMPRWLEQQAERFLAAVDLLWDSDFNAQSAVPGVTTGYIVTHVARCADDCADRLQEIRTGDAGPFDSDRRFPEDPGGLRPGAVLIEDVIVAIERSDAELRAFADGDMISSDAVAQIQSEFLVELVLHHADLGDAPLSGLDESLVEAVFSAVIQSVAADPSWPAIEAHSGPELWVAVQTGQATVSVRGESAALLAWVTGRPVTGRLLVTDDAPLPRLPAWTCYRSRRQRAGGSEGARS